MQRGFATILMVLIVVIVTGVGGYLAYQYTNKASSDIPPDQVACTQDAKLCPDGTSVGRIGSKCEFAVCPTPSESTSSSSISGISGWKIFKDEHFTFEYPPDWTADKTGYLDSATHLGNRVGTIGITISEGQYPYGFEGPGWEFKESNLNITINNQTQSVKEVIVSGQKAYVDFQIDKSNYRVLFGTGYPAAEASKASLVDYNSHKTTIMQILSTFKFTN